MVNDGNAIADCLVQLAPDYFTSAWRGKIISETAGNWKLRVSCVLACLLALEYVHSEGIYKLFMNHNENKDLEILIIRALYRKINHVY